MKRQRNDLTACGVPATRRKAKNSWLSMVQNNSREVAPSVRYPEPGREVGRLKQMTHGLAFGERPGLFYSQKFVSAFVVAIRQIPGIACTLKIAQEAGNAQERLQRIYWR